MTRSQRKNDHGGTEPRRRHSCFRRALSVLCGSILFAAGPALAHDDYDWINKGGYRNSRGEHCCGKDDCHQIHPAYVAESRDGYVLLLHGIVVPHAQTMKSEDGKYWACFVGRRLRCFFAPRPDS